MRGLLLGIKIIAWLCIISAFGNFVVFVISERNLSYIIDFMIGMLIGINLLRRKELARKFAIFFAYLVVICTIIFSFVTPLMAIRFHEKYDAKYRQYQEKQAKLSTLTEQRAPAEEIDNLKKEIANIQFYPEGYEKLDSILKELEESVSLNRLNIALICYQIFIIYYLKKEYVRKQFELPDALTETLKEKYSKNLQSNK